jgi:hypothetical protein
MKTPSNKAPKLTFFQELFYWIMLIAFLPGLVMSGMLFYFSIVLIYQEIYLWFKYAISIDVDVYSCLTINPKYCQDIVSAFSFDLIPQAFTQWLAHPNDWLGLHSIVIYILKIFPIWLLGFICAFAIFFAWLFVIAGLLWITSQIIRFFKVIIK